MTLRKPDYRNPEAVIMTMTKDEYLMYKENEGDLKEKMKGLEVEAIFNGIGEDTVKLALVPAPRNFLGKVFISILAGKIRFITMRAEELAQDLEDIGFTVEFS